MPTQFLSAKFKIHNPSQKRRGVLDHVLSEYTYTLADLLAYGRANLVLIQEQGKYRLIDQKTGEVKAEKYTDKSIAPLLPRPSDLAAELGSTGKEACVMDAAAMLASYLSLSESDKQIAGFPVVRDPHPQAYPNALVDFCAVGADLAAENEARYRLLRNSRSQVMPLHITRSRDFALLVDPDRQRFFLWLKLLPGKNDRFEQAAIDQDNLIDLNTGQIFSRRKSQATMLLPLEVGKNGWQYDKFIAPLLRQDPEAERTVAIKAAKLTREGTDYYIHVSFAFEVPEPYEAETLLGINRGIVHTLGWGVVDLVGNIMASGHSDDPFFEIRQRAMRRVQDKQKRFAKISRRDYKRQELDNIIHRVVNEVLAIAQQHRAMLILEDWSLVNASAFYKSAYNKINQIIGYKARLAGVPLSKRTIWSAYASQICVHCGRELHREKYSRVATCLTCARQEHVDEINAINIARRYLYKKIDWGGSKDKPGNWREFHCGFEGADFRAETDLRKEGGGR